MPAPSPIDIKDPVLMLTISIDGMPLDDSVPVQSLEITQSINKIPEAQLSIIFSNPATGNADIKDSQKIKPGSTIEVKTGYGADGAMTLIFKGVITKKKVSLKTAGSYTLDVSCSHSARNMTFGKNAVQYTDKTDSDVIKAIVGLYSGLSCKVDATTVTRETTLKPNDTSDWDFIMTLAEFNGKVISFDGDTVVVAAPSLSPSPVLRVAFGESIESFDASIDTEDQPASVTAMSKSKSSSDILKAKANEPGLPDPLKSAIAAGSSQRGKDRELWASPGMASDELQTWADGRLLRHRLSAFKGSVSFIGSSLVKPGDVIQLDGVGSIYNGTAYVSEVSHSIDEGHWTTKVKFGLEADSVADQKGFASPAAEDGSPAVKGLQQATVTKLSGDPESKYRVQIKLVSQSSDPEPMWAILGTPYGTNQAGWVFLPEPGDNVVVGFCGNNAKDPVILGSFYDQVKVCPSPAPDENNYIKSLKTKSGLKVSFDDNQKILTIETSGGNKVTLDDNGKAIKLADQNGNTVTMDQNGIALQSNKDISVKAGGNLTLTATGKVNISADQDVAVSGNNISQSAKMGFTAKGNSSAELSASGMTTVKGATVAIN
ncbi:MAG TPA: phage baseplate assembly protein V [Puia sp.]|jgi:phage protein D|nr:phage baseplate assembly protein V [Puia sp.]